MVKTAEQLAAMRRAGQIVGSVLYDIEQVIRVGLTPRELDQMARMLIAARGGQPAFLGYQGYPATICVSVNDAVVHEIPRHQPLAAGDVVGIDVGASVNGWYADAAVTIGLPPLAQPANRLLQVTEEALTAGIARVAPGRHLGDVQAAIERIIRQAGLGIVEDLTGHGIGQRLHEPPSIPNYGNPGTGPLLRAGMVFCLEPMATLGKPAVFLDDDHWTIRTRDRSLAAQFEHTIAVTQTGAEVLTLRRPWPGV